jgi:hypothetical protein
MNSFVVRKPRLHLSQPWENERSSTWKMIGLFISGAKSRDLGLGVHFVERANETLA